MGVTSAESRIAEAVRARSAKMTDDLRTLVAMPTGCGHVEGLEHTREWFKGRLGALGATLTRARGGVRPDWLRESALGDDSADVLVADRTAVGAGGPKILIAGHLDTVHDPHGPFQELSVPSAGRCTGPGAADMKGGLVVALTALEVLEHCDVQFPWTVVLNADEETGSFVSAEILKRLAATHDIGLVVEPAFGEGDFVTTRPGSAQFLLEAFGREAHAGRDAASGVSAVGALCKAVTTVLERSDPSSGITLNIGPLEGGRATNIVPGFARAWGNARYRSEQQREVIERLLHSVECGAEGDIPRVRTQVIHNRPIKPATARVEALAAVAVGVAADLGVPAGCAATGGVSDANVLQAAGLPCLDGLGVRGGNLHRLDEFVVVESLAERASIFAVLLARLAARTSVP